MQERPILFSVSMVKAILEGRKTQTRRVMKNVPPDAEGPFEAGMAPQSGPYSNQWAMKFDGKFVRQRCPYGQIADRLWVRETFVFECDVNGNQPPFDDGRPIQRDETIDSVSSWTQPHYRATDPAPDLVCQNPAHDGGPCYHWRPSIYMPRWASRITLEITKIRVERVQEISEEDAQAEGMEFSERVGLWTSPAGNCVDASLAYKYLWDSINAKRGFGWDKNPWAWVVEFNQAATG